MKKIVISIIMVCFLGILVIFNITDNNNLDHTFQRWREDINIDDLKLSYTGKGVCIALIDTGVDVNHPDLLNTNIKCIGIDTTTNTDDNYEHGTAMAGILAGYPSSENGILGIAPDVELISIDYSDKNYDEVNKLISAIDIAINENADLINISMGVDKDYQELHKVIKKAYDKGIIIIAAAGNGNSGEVLYPARYIEVISVGALDKDGSFLFDKVAIKDIDIFGPGKNIVTTYSSAIKDKKYTSADGCSPATAIVSGVVSLLVEKYPEISIEDIFKYCQKEKILNASNILSYNFK